ncbi:hypothetical protein [Vreelandella venusta]|uniref:Uncharacterized protein n=1 Tax=Vreelandella venusta TaxID=44935 RepID=A0ABX2BCD3_9GAMM|nr:hypothetical protein [Halomonas venusta]AZM96167.1 hypothetical protein EI420_10950 [Halomonas venusta]NPT30536.1 hypothetical protein [Halomonas venusta]
MKTTKLMLAVRKPNGTIGYLSEGVDQEKIISLIADKEGVLTLKDFSPIVEDVGRSVIENIKGFLREEMSNDIFSSYNAVFNYWQESKTYRKKDLKMVKSEFVCQQANSFLSKVQLRLQEKDRVFYDNKFNLGYVMELERECNMYMGAILCFIHAKAYLDIESFEEDIILNGYAEFLYNFLTEKYLKYLDFYDFYFPRSDSFLYSLAIEDSECYELFSQALPVYIRREDLVSEMVKIKLGDFKKGMRSCYDNFGGNFNCVQLSWRPVDYNNLNKVEIFRDLIFKIRSICQLLNKLKGGGIFWDAESEFSDEVKSYLQTTYLEEVFKKESSRVK